MRIKLSHSTTAKRPTSATQPTARTSERTTSEPTKPIRINVSHIVTVRSASDNNAEEPTEAQQIRSTYSELQRLTGSTAPSKRQVKNRGGRTNIKRYNAQQTLARAGGYASPEAAIYAAPEAELCVTVPSERGWLRNEDGTFKTRYNPTTGRDERIPDRRTYRSSDRGGRGA